MEISLQNPHQYTLSSDTNPTYSANLWLDRKPRPTSKLQNIILVAQMSKLNSEESEILEAFDKGMPKKSNHVKRQINEHAANK